MHPLHKQTTHTGITIVIVVICMAISAYLAIAGIGPLSLVIFVAGTVGGVANNFRRVQKLALGTFNDIDLASSRLVTIQLYVSPMIGGIFAFVLYVIFMSGLLQGSFFPEFKSINDTYETFAKFAALTEPATHIDVAKAVLWAFIAGFSEGLVPNFIDKIANQAIENEKPEVSA